MTLRDIGYLAIAAFCGGALVGGVLLMLANVAAGNVR